MLKHTNLWPAAATAVLLSSAWSLQANAVDIATAVPQPTVDALWGDLNSNPPNTTRRAVLTGTNFDTGGTKLFFDPPASRVTFRVLSSTRIALFVKNRESYGRVAKREPLKIVAIETGAGAVQVNPEDGGLMIGYIAASVENSDKQVDVIDIPPPVVHPFPEAINRWPEPLWVHGANFNMEYTELYFSPPLPEEFIDIYEVSRPDLVSIVLKHKGLVPGPLRVVAIDTGSGVVHLNPEGGGIVVGMVLSNPSVRDITVKDDESVHIYQSTKQFQITGSGFKDNTKVLFMTGLCGGEIRSPIHTKVGEQPDQLTLELAEGYSWYDKNPAHLPRPLELKSVDAGKGWSQLGPDDAPGKAKKVAIVFQDPSIEASDTGIYRGYTRRVEIHGAGFRLESRIRRQDWVYRPVTPTLVFDPPIDHEVFVNSYNQVTVNFQPEETPQWPPAGYFGPLKIKGLDTGAGMVALDPPVTVGIVVPGSPFDFFLLKRIQQMQEDGAIKHHQDRVDQAAREWQAMTVAEQAQAAGALVPRPSVEASSTEIYVMQTYIFVVEGADFSPGTKLLFDPPLHENDEFDQEFLSATRLEFCCLQRSCYLTEPGELKVVAIDTGADIIRPNPEDGGAVVAFVKPDITVQQDEDLLIYQSTKQLRIAGGGLDNAVEVRFHKTLHAEEAKFSIIETKPDELTLSLEEGGAWIKEASSLPMALLVSGVKGGPGMVTFDHISAFPAEKVATVFEDPSVNASATEIYRGFTRELSIHGTGFTNVVQPVLVFAPPLDDEAVSVHVMNRTMICLTLSATRADWTKAEDYLGPLALEGLDTGAGMVVFDSPITVATVSPSAGTHGDKAAQVATYIDALPSVNASSGQLFMRFVNTAIILRGANFNLRPKLYFDSPLPENTVQQFISSREIAITLPAKYDEAHVPRAPNPWRAEPGPLKVVAIDIGAGRVPLNPEGGGVVAATILADVMIQNNEELHVYQSTREIEVTGSGFDNDIEVPFLGSSDGMERTGAVSADTSSGSQLTIKLAEGSVWLENPNILPGALWMDCEIDVAGFKSVATLMDGISLSFGGPVATVFEDPSINASAVEINRTGSQELVVRGTGFNDMAPPVVDFDPPLDSTNLRVHVVNRTMIQLKLDTAESGWVPVEQLGPLKIKGVDTGAGMVVFDSPVTVATVVPDSEPLFNQGVDVDLDAFELAASKSAAPALNEPEEAAATPALKEPKQAAEPKPEEYSEQVGRPLFLILKPLFQRCGRVQVDNTVVLPPSVEASSTASGLWGSAAGHPQTGLMCTRWVPDSFTRPITRLQ